MKIAIPNNWFHQLLFILCIAVPYLDTFELTISVWSLAFMLTLQRRYSISLLKLVIPFALILLIATIVSFNFDYQKYLVIRDITYLCKPIIGFFLGYQLCQRNLQNAFRLIVKTGVFIAVCHIITLFGAVFVFRASTVAEIRYHSGYFSDYEIYTFVILLFHKQFQLDYPKKTLRILTVIVGFSAFMYLARTNFIQFVILFVAVKGYLVINKKALMIIGSIVITSVVGYFIVVSTSPRRGAEGVEGFLYKIKVAPMEPFKSKINREDYRDFNDNYRSYENIMTIRQVTRDGAVPTIFGKGIGSQIDLKQNVWLGDMFLRFISILHNGFMIVFLKSGLLGIFIYLFTIIFFFRKVKTDKPIVSGINLLFIGTGVFLLVSNWVFLGFYNLTETKSILIGFLIAYRENKPSMKSILFIHQSAELYGSDKTILMFISSLDKQKYKSVVILPFDGPLKREFEKNGIEVVIAPVLKLYRKMFTPKGILNFFKEYHAGLKTLNALHKKHHFSIVYSHTLAALIGIIFARKNNIKHLWHVQEIIAKPVIFNKGFVKLLSLDCNHVAAYDSIATMNFWIKGNEKLSQKSHAVWNGLDVTQKQNATPEEIASIRKDFFKVSGNELVIALVGRINSWKGQQLLLEAFHKIADKHQNIKLVFIGSAPPNQEIFETDLKNKITDYSLSERVVIIPFQEGIWKFWDSIDIAVVPSTEPEPFGMVAIEAMLSKKPVIAANHGGLAEIVLPNETGILFEPNNANALATALESLITDAEKRKLFGENGYTRTINHFSLQKHVEKFEDIFEKI